MATLILAPTAPSTALPGIAWKVASTVLFTGMLTLVKLVDTHVPVGEVLFARNFFGLIPVVAWVAMHEGLGTALRTKQPFGHVKRSLVGALAMGLWFAALSRLPLPEATAIVYLAPLILVIFAATMLGETVRLYRWSAVAIGFCGVMVIMVPQVRDALGGTDISAAIGGGLAFVAAFFMALAGVFVRQLTGSERTSTIVLYFFIGASAISLVSLPFGWVIPSGRDLALLVMIGVLGGIGQLMVTHAYRLAEASTIAPFEYTSMIWAVAISILVFGEYPDASVIVGGVIVISSGVFIILRERRLGLNRRERRLGAPLRP